MRRVTGGRKEFVNIALIDDKVTGSFRGMAFVNFHSTPDATAALAELSKMVINGRKVIAEYRRLRPGERERKEQQEKRAKKYDNYNYNNRQTFEKHITTETDPKGKTVDKRAIFFAKRDTVKKADEQKRQDEKVERDKERETEFRNLLLEYGEGELEHGEDVKDLIFDASLTSYERRMVHEICSQLNLGHISRSDENGNRVLHVTRDAERAAEWKHEAQELKKSESRKQSVEQRRKNKDGVNGGALTKEETQGISWFTPRAAMAKADGSNTSNSGIRAPSYKLYVPPCQPTGPDGSIGFKCRVGKAVCSPVDTTTAHDDDLDGEGSASCNGSHGIAEMEEVISQGMAKVEQKTNKGMHTTLNPSVPAFSPSNTPSF